MLYQIPLNPPLGKGETCGSFLKLAKARVFYQLFPVSSAKNDLQDRLYGVIILNVPVCDLIEIREPRKEV